MPMQSHPTVVTLVTTHRGTRPTQVHERWRVDFDFPSGGAMADVDTVLLDELRSERRTAVIRSDGTASKANLVELSIRALCLARCQMPTPAVNEADAYPWDRADLSITSYSETPFGHRWLRLVIDGMAPQSIGLYWDDQGELGKSSRARTAADTDPALLVMSEALNGPWRISDTPVKRHVAMEASALSMRRRVGAMA